jgi:hypothetical protein
VRQVATGYGLNGSHPLPSGGRRCEVGFHRLATGGYVRQVATPEEPNRLLPGTRWGCRDGDRLEAYPTVVVGRYLDCKIGN